MIDAPTRVSPDLKISGHLLTTMVVSGMKPLGDVSISLFSENLVKVGFENFGYHPIQIHLPFFCSARSEKFGQCAKK